MMDYNEFMTLASGRRSVRQFTGQKPDRQLIAKLIEAASWAPSNHNRQGWKFIVFDDAEEIARLARLTVESLRQLLASSDDLPADKAQHLLHYAGLFAQAPILILVMHKRSPAISKNLIQPTSELASGEAISAAMACQNLILAAHSLGLGSCVMTAPLLAGDPWQNIDDLPAGYTPNCLITLGYPAEQPQAPRRKNIEHIIEYRT